VTNPFEYYLLSPVFDQWSYTFMLEARVQLAPRLELFAEGEQRVRVANRGPGTWLTAVTPDGFTVPGRKLDAFYRTGLGVYPWRGLPHRARAFVTNKQAHCAETPTLPVAQRFQPGTYYVLSLEAFL